MPKDFNRCVKKGGRVRTRKLPKGRYQRVCFDEKGGHAGEVKKRKPRKK